MQTLVAADREAWRDWLAANHETAKRIWLVYFKKGGRTSSGKAEVAASGIAYEDSVEEALCFGWIDSLIKRIDDTKYARLFTPRSDEGNWSAVNRRRVAKVIAEGRMTPAGLAKAGFLSEPARPAPRQKPAVAAMPEYMRLALQADKGAWRNYNRLAPSYQRLYIAWIASAKKEQTRRRRLAEAVELLAENRKLGLK
jgi:uncharacterized protein YdeI (YjbR/CyaY-like superfamily)